MLQPSRHFAGVLSAFVDTDSIRWVFHGMQSDDPMFIADDAGDDMELVDYKIENEYIEPDETISDFLRYRISFARSIIPSSFTFFQICLDPIN